MKDSRILSAFHDDGTAPVALAASGLSASYLPQQRVYDTCKLGVVGRALLFALALVSVAALFVAPDVAAWAARAALYTLVVVPALLAWLLAVCALKQPLSRLPLGLQWWAGALLGAGMGLGSSALMAWLGWVKPPWLASAAAGALVAAVLTGWLVWRAQAQVPAGTTTQLAELQARIRPHFLFNTLNSAIALVRKEPAKAESLLEDLSELFRHALADTQEAVPLSQELELARHYLAIEQVRFGDRLKIEWRIDEEAANARLPPLILQPLVENAVKHGVEPSPDGARVRISTERRGPVVVIKVTNTVPHGSGPRGNGLALDNVRQRLTLLHEEKGRFECALVNGVFQVRLQIPV
jgi:two-component system, LytTR family, sensor histidine kinase AlgZ